MANNRKGFSDLPEKDEVIQLTESQLQTMIASAVSAALQAAPAKAASQTVVTQSNTPSRIKIEEDFNRKMMENNNLAVRISQEETVLYAIPQIYGQYTGEVIASVNGQTIKIPADGVQRRIPKRYVPIIAQYLANIDAKVAAMQATTGQYGGVAQLEGGAL
jgi:hypothetical protein